MEVGLTSRPTANGMEFTVTAIARSQPECKALLLAAELPGQLRMAGSYPALRWRDVLPSSDVTATLLARLTGAEISLDLVLTTLQQLGLEAVLHGALSFRSEAIAPASPADPVAVPACSADTHPLALSAA